jgi:hypothetical protein
MKILLIIIVSLIAEMFVAKKIARRLRDERRLTTLPHWRLGAGK